MESQDKRMCKTESAFSGVSVDYNQNQNHRVYDEDCFGDILNMFDFPMEGLEGDGFAEDWASKLGPIPSEVFKELGVSNTFVPSTDLPFEYPVLNNRALHSQPKEAFEAPSPNSVLENRSSSSNSKPISLGIEHSIPVRSRSKRFRPTSNPWLLSPLISKEKKRKTASEIPVFIKRSNVTGNGIKKCAHCEITKTPQWREGPMGPKTLCNACGVRYRSGRLFPEYRPAASPTFVPALHSNSHRKVIEMRNKTVE